MSSFGYQLEFRKMRERGHIIHQLTHKSTIAMYLSYILWEGESSQTLILQLQFRKGINKNRDPFEIKQKI